MTEQSKLLQQVEEILRYAETATKGLWKSSREDMDSYTTNEDGEMDSVAYVYHEPEQRIPVFGKRFREDSRFIAHARVDVPALCSALVTLAQAVEAREERALAYIDRNANPQAYVDAVCRESEAYFKGLALLRDGMQYGEP